MDILRKELEDIYRSQRLWQESLDAEEVASARRLAEAQVRITDGCAVLTDAATDRCYVYSGSFGPLFGYRTSSPSCLEADSSDEDVVYERIHPEDLVEKRLLEYEFFMQTERNDMERKTDLVAYCSIRMRGRQGEYRLVDNSTQLIRLSPKGKIWLILCTYRLSAKREPLTGIDPCIVNTATGEIRYLSFHKKRQEILSSREKEVLALIRDGQASKQIAAILGISINTVNRHRQNILNKLSVGNSVEAVNAAILMRLL